MKKIARSNFCNLYKDNSFTNSSMLLYLFLNRSAMEVEGEYVIEDFSRNSIIEDIKSILPNIHTGTMYQAFDMLFDKDLIVYGIDAEGVTDENTLYIIGSADGFYKGNQGFLPILDLFFTPEFNELRLGTKRLLLYLLHRIGKKSNMKISLSFLVKELAACADLKNKYKILRAIRELKVRGILDIIELSYNVFNFKLNELSNSQPKSDYIIDLKNRHKKKSLLIQELFSKAKLELSDKQLNYIIKALFRNTLGCIKKVILTYIDVLKTGTEKYNTYRFVKSLIQEIS